MSVRDCACKQRLCRVTSFLVINGLAILSALTGFPYLYVYSICDEAILIV